MTLIEVILTKLNSISHVYWFNYKKWYNRIMILAELMLTE